MSSYFESNGAYTFSADLVGQTVAITYTFNLPTQVPVSGLTLFEGATRQAPWGVIEAMHPDQALGYNEIAYVAGASYALDGSAALENHNFEISGYFANAVQGSPDANPASVIVDFLTHPDHGVGFPGARVGDLSGYAGYCQAAGLLVSPAYSSLEAARDSLARLAAITNSEFVWSSGQLTVVPYGDRPLNANGTVYNPPAQPLFDLGEDDFIADSSGDPVQLARARPADQINTIKLEYVNRANQYNVDVVEAKDEAMIALFGRRAASATKAHELCDPDVARTSAQLMLQRQAIRNTYTFKLGWRYVLLDPMDIVTITDQALGLEKQWVRILEMQEDDAGGLTVTAEEYLSGTGATSKYASQSGAGGSVDFNSPAGNANPPVFFEPPDQLSASGLEVWIAASGPPMWGGADVWISTDGASYRNAGRIATPARMGVLASALPAFAGASANPAIDEVNVLAVDLTESRGQLGSGATADALSLNSLCYVDGELIAYATATLTGANEYALSFLVRGAYGTPVSSHASGSAFARLDQAIFKYPFDRSAIGQPIYVKLLSFNVFGVGAQSLAEVQPYTYVPRGTAFASLLPNVRNLISAFVGGITVMQWDPVIDFRTIDYEVRFGPSWATGRFLGRAPSNSFPSQGDGTYWIAAHSNPVPRLDVYSAIPVSLAITGSVLVRNVVATFDEAAAGWPGTLSENAIVNQRCLELAGAGNVLAQTNMLGIPDMLWLGGVGTSGTYAFPASQTVNIGRVASCSVNFAYDFRGQSIYDNVLTQPNLLAATDLLGAALGSKVSAQPQIALAQGNGAFGPWQNWTPGQYQAQQFKARVAVTSGDPQVRAIVSALTFLVDVPDRVDKGTATAVPASGLAVTYSAPFNIVPNVQVTILAAQAGDDAIIGVSTANGFTVQIVNGESVVARTINWVAQGF